MSATTVVHEYHFYYHHSEWYLAVYFCVGIIWEVWLESRECY